MRYIVLFQQSCIACSKVASMVRELAVTNLEALPLEDPQVTALLGGADALAFTRPSLVRVDSQGVEVLTGWAMRRCLARVVGWRHSVRIVRLLGAEWKARLVRSADARGPSRRGIIGGALAGLGGWALMSGTAAASPGEGATSPNVILPADPAEVERALATAPMRQAIRTWGPVEGQAMHISAGGQSVIALAHTQRGILTFVDNSPGALRAHDPVALSIGPTPMAEHGIRYYTVAGAPLTDLTVLDGRVLVSAVQHTGTGVEPDVTLKTFIFCFTACVAEKNLSASCLQSCFNCGENLIHGNAGGAIISCGQCAACAGPHGINCAKECIG